MSGPIGNFAGKVVFGSSTAKPGPVSYLTTIKFKRPGKDPLQLPAMAATAITPTERCILYARADGTIALQLGGLLWVAFDEDLGWLVTTPYSTNAASLTLGGSPWGQSWQIATSKGLQPVFYTVGGPDPLLTINGGTAEFAPRVVTPSLAAIVQSHSCPNADLADVDLRGVHLSGIDFSSAVLARTQLDGASLGCTFTHAVFDEATVGSATFNGAVLDSASFIGATLIGAAWGTPKSATRIVLTDCHAAGATLGQQSPPLLDCSNAILSGGDFRGANLRWLKLSGATAGGALLSGCHLDHAVLDGADLTGAVADGATLTWASLQGTSAQGA
jgi:hypothetical protein